MPTPPKLEWPVDAPLRKLTEQSLVYQQVYGIEGLRRWLAEELERATLLIARVGSDPNDKTAPLQKTYVAVQADGDDDSNAREVQRRAIKALRDENDTLRAVSNNMSEQARYQSGRITTLCHQNDSLLAELHEVRAKHDEVVASARRISADNDGLRRDVRIAEANHAGMTNERNRVRLANETLVNANTEQAGTINCLKAKNEELEEALRAREVQGEKLASVLARVKTLEEAAANDENLAAEVEALRYQVHTLREASVFYAEPGNWKKRPGGRPANIVEDNGDKARAALAELDPALSAGDGE